MKKRILTRLEHNEVCDFLEDRMYGRPLKFTPTLKRCIRQAKENIELLRNHVGLLEQIFEVEV